MKIAFIYSRTKLSGKLTKLVTGSYCFHVAFVDEERGLMFDMHLIRRIRDWPHYKPEDVVLVDCPVPVSYDYLFNRVKSDENTYGWIDYTLFLFRWVFHLLGRSTPNAGGVICSEMVADDLAANGWKVTFVEVPSPADLERALDVSAAKLLE